MIRAEIDETDIGKIKLGQEARITADAFPGRSFTARLVRISGGIGKKEILTDNPMDKVDTEILETFLELEPDAPLRVGLRVDLHIQLEYKNDNPGRSHSCGGQRRGHVEGPGPHGEGNRAASGAFGIARRHVH